MTPGTCHRAFGDIRGVNMADFRLPAVKQPAGKFLTIEQSALVSWYEPVSGHSQPTCPEVFMPGWGSGRFLGQNTFPTTGSGQDLASLLPPPTSRPGQPEVNTTEHLYPLFLIPRDGKNKLPPIIDDI